MLKISSKDLVIRLDEQKNVLQLLVPNVGGKSGELRVFYEISEDEALGEESIESHIGATVLAFLSSTYTASSYHLEQYRQAGESFDMHLSGDSALLNSGDADSEFEGAMLRIHRFDETWSVEDVDGMTAFLDRCAKCGSEKATKFLQDDWPTRSKLMKKRLGRGQ